MTDLILGIDIGTTAVKLAAYDLAGVEVFRRATPYPTRHAAAIAEQDPSDWLSLVDEGLADLAAAALADRVRAVGVTSQVNTHVFVDGKRHPLHRAITWKDGRCAAQAARIDAEIDHQTRLEWFGAPMPIDASHMVARMAWMAETHPDIWARTAAVLLPKDLAIAHLTGAVLSDPVSHIGAIAPRGGFAPVFDRVAGARTRLPGLQDPTSIAGMTTLPGASGPIPVATGLMDAWAGMLGVGTRRDGQAMYLSGTSEIAGVLSPNIHAAPGILVFPPYAGITMHVAPTQAGGAALDWIAGVLGLSPAQAIATAKPAAALFLPHLPGERAPLWDAHARGTFLGLTPDMGPAELAHCVLEGVAMAVRLAFEGLDQSAGLRANILNCGGGGFASDRWNQIRANMLDRTLQCVAARDPGALGAAAVAAVAAGLHPNLDAALSQTVRFDRRFVPDRAARDRSDALFALYQPAYEAARATNHALAAL